MTAVLHPGAIFGLVMLVIGVPVIVWLNVRGWRVRRQADTDPAFLTGEERDQ